MSASVDASLAAELARWESRGLKRELDGAPVARDAALDFASNDYLSLARDERVIEAAREALARHGAGGRASRLLGGGCPLDREAEMRAREWLGADEALLFPSGYQANLGLLTALARAGDCILSDERNHASLIDAARLSKARVLVTRHDDVEHVAACLESARGASNRWVVTEGVFSMDGDKAPLAELAELCARHDAWLVVDEAHAAGLLGPRGAGAWAAVAGARPTSTSGARVSDPEARVVARVVTGGKALGANGAFVLGSKALREHLVHRARSFVYTTAVSPAVSGALCAAIEIASRESASRERVLALAARLARAIGAPAPDAAIVPWIAGDAAAATSIAARLTARGLDARAVRPPTVPEGSARLRLVAHAHNDEAAVDLLARELRLVGHEVRDAAAQRSRAAIEVRDAPESSRSATAMRSVTRVLFVVGTDTGVGKTATSALLLAAARARGRAVYWKPVQTGDACDTAEVRRLAGVVEDACAEPSYRFALGASPHEAAEREGRSVDLEALQARLASIKEEIGGGTLIVELAGGLCVPYDATTTQADWLAREDAGIVLVARNAVGTLNHTLLTLEALAARRLEPRALFLVGEPSEFHRRTLGRASGSASVHEVPRFEPLDARAIERWIAAHDLAPLFDR